MYLLLEDGGHFLLEDGSRLALEDGIVPSLLLENGEHLLLEDGGRLLLEGEVGPIPPVITQTSSGSGYKGRYRKTVFNDPIEKEKIIEVKLYKDFKVIKAHVWDKSSSISKVVADNFRPTKIISAELNSKIQYHSKSVIKGTAQRFAVAKLKSSQIQIAQANAIRSASAGLYQQSIQTAFGTAVNLNSTISRSQYNSIVFADRHAISRVSPVYAKHVATAQADQIVDFTPEQMEMLMMVIAKEFLN